jgi:hypothetical protein
MNNRTRFLWVLVLLALPLLVAWFAMPVWGALLLVVLAVGLRQLLVLGGISARRGGPDLVLETIPPSHFAEKARWCMDRLGVAYDEKMSGGVIGALFTGRSIPRLTVRTGRTQSSISESSHILRYLYGRYAADAELQAAFLAPTEARLAWEQRLDRYGVDQQVWIYYHLLSDPALCKQAWGAHNPRVPAWHRWAILVLYPLLEFLIKRGFDPSQERYEKAVARTEALLAETEALLADGRDALLGSEEIDFVDITLASLSALWIQADEFDCGRFLTEQIAPDKVPPKLLADQQRWKDTYPATTAHIQRLYREQRTPTHHIP